MVLTFISIPSFTGINDCPEGEDERVQYNPCTDLDLNEFNYNCIAIPLAFFLIILFCCYKTRGSTARDPNDDRVIRRLIFS